MPSKTELWTRQLWDRLSADPSALRLDWRTEEEPEDVFIQRAYQGDRDNIVRALNSLLLTRVLASSTPLTEADIRFFERSLRLCDSIATKECKDILKYILFIGPSDRWNDCLPAMQELAARTLSGFDASETELPFWRELASRRDTTFPYALTALFEIDLHEAIRVACTTVYEIVTAGDDPEDLVDWEFVFQLAKDLHARSNFAVAIESAVEDVVDKSEVDQRDALFKKLGHWAHLPDSAFQRHDTLAGLRPYVKSTTSSTSRLTVEDFAKLYEIIGRGDSEDRPLKATTVDSIVGTHNVVKSPTPAKAPSQSSPAISGSYEESLSAQGFPRLANQAS